MQELKAEKCKEKWEKNRGNKRMEKNREWHGEKAQIEVKHNEENEAE